MLNILGIPMGDTNIASSRIRFYSYLNYLCKNKVSFTVFNETSDIKHCNVFYVQKFASPAVIKLVKLIKNLSYKITIVYDIDDDIDEYKSFYGANFNGEEMLNLANFIITDTHDRKIALESLCSKSITIIPDCIDYWENIQNQPIKTICTKIKTIGTFGNPKNSISGTIYWKSISDHIEKLVISVPNLETPFRLITWKLDTFISNLRTLDVCVLSNPKSHISTLKSNNRLLVCMAAGIPTICNNTPGFTKTLFDAGLGELVFNNEQEFYKIFEKIKAPSYRKEIQDKGLDYVHRHYSPKKIANKFFKTIEYMHRVDQVSKTRTHVINSLIQTFNYQSYLEIGVRDRKNFDLINIKIKDGVDPAGNCNFPMTSDVFFHQLSELSPTKQYDLIFIDGLHLETQVIRDISHALQHLNKNGTIVLHDCKPGSKFHQEENRVTSTGIPKDGVAWNGTVWKAFMHYRTLRSDLTMFTIDTDWGIGIIKHGKQVPFTLDEDIFNYEVFEKHMTTALNLISPTAFLKWLEERNYK